MTDAAGSKDFKPEKHRVAYIEWMPAPDKSVRTDACMILISGGAYQCCCDVNLVKQWCERLTREGIQCVNFVYRTPRPEGLPIYQSAWEDAQRAVEFMRQMQFYKPLEPEVSLMSRFESDSARREVLRQDVWKEGAMPCAQEKQCKPFIEWHFPKVLKTKAIQIIYSGGAYMGNDTYGFEVMPARRYLNDLGMTVVTMQYRTPRPEGLAKHTTAWQDLQRAIKLVRSQAAQYGLDGNQIGIMGSSAGGHLTLMGVTSSMHQAYNPIDEIDRTPCNVQWGIGIYPAYVLSDGADGENSGKGNADDATIVPDFSFDLNTAPMIFIHGDADGYSPMGSVKVWEKMRSMGIQSELHTLCLRQHCFQRVASPGTGSYTWLDRIGEFLRARNILK